MIRIVTELASSNHEKSVIWILSLTIRTKIRLPDQFLNFAAESGRPLNVDCIITDHIGKKLFAMLLFTML